MQIERLMKGALICAALLAAAGAVRAQSEERRVTITVRPAQSAEERVADEFKEKELRRAAEEKLAAEKSAQLARQNPKALLAQARTFYVTSATSYFKPVQLQDALRQRTEFDAWQLALIDGWDNQKFADVQVEVGRPLFTYNFTYQLTDRRTGIVLAAGKVTAFDGTLAAPKLAERIVAELKKARGEQPAK